MTDLFPKKQSDTPDYLSTKVSCRNIVVNSSVSRKLSVWHPGLNPILHPDHSILGTVLAAESKHHWIIKWDALKSVVSKEIEHHHSVHHSTALRLEDNHDSKVLVGIITNRENVGFSLDSEKPVYCTQPDVDCIIR